MVALKVIAIILLCAWLGVMAYPICGMFGEKIKNWWNAKR